MSSSSGAAQASFGVRGGGADHLVGELADHVDEHLLVLGGGQVEECRVLSAPGARTPCFALPARAKVRLAAVIALEPAAGHRVDGLLGLLAQPEPVEQVAWASRFRAATA